MAEMGMALMGAAVATGENRAIEAAQRAISSPLLEEVSIKGARGLLINITGGTDLSLYEVNEAASLIQEEAHEDANIIFGAVIDEQVTQEIRVTVIATGFGDLGTTHASSSLPFSSAARVSAPPRISETFPVEPPTPVTEPAPIPSPIPTPAPTMQYKTPTAQLRTPAPQIKMPQAPLNRPIRRLGLIVDDDLDIPTFKRRSEEPVYSMVHLEPSHLVESEENLDIPTFLRKQ